ncbi:hypothetical protein ACFO4O_14585 [Glaciecola siphonariae]|uniref:Uncharacterized protein n=1 Tax=Glaciecola siphonariae TaxID=521012 RepID=A0ABV9M172_9ALTE
MTYDALEQIATASGSWGTGSFSFDSLGNVRSKRIGGRTITVNYNAKNQVSSANDIGAIAGSTAPSTVCHYIYNQLMILATHVL